MAAVRLARGATGRSKIVKFEGCYHGHSDSLLAKAGVLVDRKVLSEIAIADLASTAGLRAGRDVLLRKCVACHDLRTVLMQQAHVVDLQAGQVGGGAPGVLGERLGREAECVADLVGIHQGRPRSLWVCRESRHCGCARQYWIAARVAASAPGPAIIRSTTSR